MGFGGLLQDGVAGEESQETSAFTSFSGPHFWQRPLMTESIGTKGQWKNIFQVHLRDVRYKL